MKQANHFAHLLKSRNPFQFILPILFTIVISALYSLFVLLSNSLPYDSTPLSSGFGEFFIALNILVLVIASIGTLFAFFHFFKQNSHLALKVLNASFMLGGVLSTLLFAKLVFGILELESPLMLLVVALVTYVGAYFAYLVIVDALSNRMKNLLFVICSGALGSFLGVLLPVIPTISMLLLLSLLDLILVKMKIVERIVGEVKYERLMPNVAFSNEEWGIGIGDLTCYAITVSNTLANFGVLAGLSSLLLVLVGSFVSFALVSRMLRIPGLPITITMGLLPSIIFTLMI